MHNWASLPALRAAIAFAAGIALSTLVDQTMLSYALLALAIVASAILLAPLRLDVRGGLRGGAALLLVIGLGLLAGYSSKPDIQSHQIFAGEYSLMEVVEKPKIGQRYVATTARLYAPSDTERDIDKAPLARVNLPLVLAGDSLGIGSLVLAKAHIRAPRAALNPYTFDYRAYLASTGVHLQAFVKPFEAKIVRGPTPASSLQLARNWIASRLEAAFPTPREAAVAKALVLGDRSDLDQGTREVYTKTGAVHVLAVSGLHTGIIAAILIWLLARVGEERFKFLRVVLFWLGLLAYVALTGFSPSVQRSALMFGILFAGQLMRLDTSSLNSLGISAFVLLVFDPQMLFTLGFQLSFAAVAGIVTLYPSLRRLVSSPHESVNFFSDLVVISIAATLATAPITAFHFHQFPVYFMISGMMAVPLISLALPFAVGALAIDFCTSLFGISAYWAYTPAYVFVWLCNASLDILADLPGALAQGLWPSVRTSSLYFTTVSMLGAMFYSRQQWMTWVVAGSMLLAVSSSTLDAIVKLRSSETITFGARNEMLTYLKLQGSLHAFTASDEQLSNWTQAAAKEYRGALHLPEPSTTILPVAQIPVLVQADHHRWIVLPDSAFALAPQAPDVDWVVVRDVRNTSPAGLVSAFAKTQMLLTDYIPSWRRAEWSPLITHVLPVAGAFIH